VVVTRYFGGIKLGTGGIARAYSSTVNLAINNCLTQEVQLSTDYSLISPFNRTGEIEHAIKLNSGVRLKHRLWLDSGLQLTLAIDDIAFNNFLISISGYQHELIIVKIDSDNK
jgi:putative IMPACT (imprinted ancient) family translation regulator